MSVLLITLIALIIVSGTYLFHSFGCIVNSKKESKVLNTVLLVSFISLIGFVLVTPKYSINKEVTCNDSSIIKEIKYMSAKPYQHGARVLLSNNKKVTVYDSKSDIKVGVSVCLDQETSKEELYFGFEGLYYQENIYKNKNQIAAK